MCISVRSECAFTAAIRFFYFSIFIHHYKILSCASQYIKYLQNNLIWKRKPGLRVIVLEQRQMQISTQMQMQISMPC